MVEIKKFSQLSKKTEQTFRKKGVKSLYIRVYEIILSRKPWTAQLLEITVSEEQEFFNACNLYFEQGPYSGFCNTLFRLCVSLMCFN